MWRVVAIVTASHGSSLRITGLCEGNPPANDGFPSSMSSIADFFLCYYLKTNCSINSRVDSGLGWDWLMWRHSWWRHQMKTFFALLGLCAGNSPVTGEFPVQRPVTLTFDVSYDLRLNKQLSKQSWDWWFETPSRPLWRHCNGNTNINFFQCVIPCRQSATSRLPNPWTIGHLLPKFESNFYCRGI